jgi:hypothetical protein
MDLVDKPTFQDDELHWQQRRLISIDDYTLREAQNQIVSCEACTPDQAEMLFDDVLDSITGNAPQSTAYVLDVPGCCPRCQRALRTGRWNSITDPDGQRIFWIVPGTLVTTTR